MDHGIDTWKFRPIYFGQEMVVPYCSNPYEPILEAMLLSVLLILLEAICEVGAVIVRSDGASSALKPWTTAL